MTRIEYQGAPPKFERQGRKSGLDDGLVQRGKEHAEHEGTEDDLDLPVCQGRCGVVIHLNDDT